MAKKKIDVGIFPSIGITYLKDGEHGNGEWIEVGRRCSILKIECTSKQLHSKKGKDEDEEKQ